MEGDRNADWERLKAAAMAMGGLQHGRGGLRMAAYVRSSSNNRNSQAGGRPTDEAGRASEQVISQNIAVGRHANAFGAQVQGMGDMLEELGESIELALNKREHEKAAMAASLTELRSALGIQIQGGLHAPKCQNGNNGRTSKDRGQSSNAARVPEQVGSRDAAKGPNVGAHDVDEIDSLNNLLEELRESIETSLNKRENDKAAMIASLKEIHNEMQRTIPQVRQYQNRDNEEASKELDERSNEEARVVPAQVGSQSAEGTQSTGTNDVRHEGEDEMERVLRKSLEDFEETEEEEVAIAMVESLQLAQSHSLNESDGPREGDGGGEQIRSYWQGSEPCRKAGDVRVIVAFLTEAVEAHGPELASLSTAASQLDESRRDFAKLNEQHANILRVTGASGASPESQMLGVRDQMRSHLVHALAAATHTLSNIEDVEKVPILAGGGDGELAVLEDATTYMEPWGRMKRVAHTFMNAAEKIEARLMGNSPLTERIGHGDSSQKTRTTQLAADIDALAASQFSLQDDIKAAMEFVPVVLEDLPTEDNRTISVELECSHALDRIFAAAKSLAAGYRQHGAVVGTVVAEWEWAREELREQKMARRKRESDYPPNTDLLQKYTGLLRDMEDEMEQLELKVKQRHRKGECTTAPEAKLSTLRERMRKYKFDVQIGRERAKLYRISQRHFPELLLPGSEWSRAVGLDPSNVSYEACRKGLLVSGRRMSDFASVNLEIDVPGAQRIYRARDHSGREWALKEFPLADESTARLFYRQVAMLDRLSHANLAKIHAVFEDVLRGSAFVQMPWYAGGNLQAWMEANPPATRTSSTCRHILQDVAIGLAHLHTSGAVHCDVKPSNIFLTSSLRAVLGDFDGVREHNKTLTVALPSGTFGYIAPEIVSGKQTQFTAACDVFSLGAVAKNLFDGVAMLDEDSEKFSETVLSAMCADPKRRLSVQQLMGCNFMAYDGPDRSQCAICFDVFEVGSGCHCSNSQTPHSYCMECVKNLVESKCNIESGVSDMISLARELGHVRCALCTKKMPMDNVRALLPVELQQRLAAAVYKGIEAMLAPKFEKELEDRMTALRAEMAESSVDAEAARAELHIIEKLLNLHCPRCGTVFDEFTGCFALKCHRCNAGICGWCMADCGNDAHPHVKECQKNRGHSEYYGTMQQFEQLRNVERRQRVTEYLATLAPNLQGKVKTRVNPHLKQLGIQKIE